VTIFAGPVASAAFVTAAVARPLEHGTFHDKFSHVAHNYCGKAGLTVAERGVVDGRFLVNVRKPGSAPHSLERIKVIEVDSNAAGESITAVSGSLTNELKITHNGDGTLTVLALETGPTTVYDNSTGKAIARNPGQVRFAVLFDQNGTPADRDDDRFLDIKQLKGSTGRNDDLCAAALDVLG
jgi:hypothetical protein